MATATELTPSQQRRQDPLLRATFALPVLLPKLPFVLPTVPNIPPSPKRHYRGQYVYRGADDLADPAAWLALSPFDLALRLFDFSPLTDPLAHKVYAQSARGHVPFHPVSLFLLLSWRLLNRWPRTQTLRNLADPRYADYGQYFGFAPGAYPTEGGLRHFETRLGGQTANDLIKQTVELAHALQCISQAAIAQGVFTTDGMLHDAASRLRCTFVSASCYQPAPRPCPARDKGKQGCQCTETACAVTCQQATPRDPQARFIVYQRHNQTDSPNASAQPPAAADAPAQAATDKAGKSSQGQGKPRYGYRSVAGSLPDAVRRCSWVLGDDLLPANAPEDQAATDLMGEVVPGYRWVNWRFAVADAGEGREPFLSTAYNLGLRRVVGLRQGPGDDDKDEQRLRGYDDKGIPLCPLGYQLRPNGWDSERHRFKWCCRRNCEQGTVPPPDCDHRFDGDKHGFIRDVGRAFGDDKTRLVRDVPYGSPAWKELYGRSRNGSEERNAELEGWGLKRMPVFGQPRVRTQVTLADMWVNLLTVVRLIREAVIADSGLSPP